MWRFGEYEVDPPARELRRSGAPVHLEPQAFDLLVCLLESRERVVSKAELLDGASGPAFLSESNLTTRVKEVRRAVGDDGRRQEVIRNVRGRGYRFVAPAEDVARADDLSSAATSASSSASVAAGSAAGDRLVGRDAECGAVTEALSVHPVVTLVGPGGVGKSTLARHVLTRAGGPGDGRFVELAALTPGDSVVAVTARAAGVVADGRSLDVARALARMDALVVLDNAEHVVDEVAALVDAVLEEPRRRLRLVVTSQVALGVAGEAVIEVRPLDAAAARALFVARAQAAAPSSWTPVEAERIDRLVDAVDGLPLAIEMAAARLRSLTFADLERLVVDEDGLGAIAHRTPIARHRSLDALTAWSAELLEPSQRTVLAACTVFAGRVPIDDAVAVLGPDDPTGTAFALAALAERSLVVADVEGTTSRYGLLTTVRTAAHRWLAPEDERTLQGRHAARVASVLREVDDLVRTPREAEARRRLDAFTDEVRAAHRWARRHDRRLAAAMSGSLFHLAYSSLWNEPAAWSEELLAGEAAGADLTASERAGPALVVAAAAAHRGELGSARSHAEAAVAVSDGRLLAKALELLADVAMYQGDLAAVAAAADGLVQLGEELDDGHARTLGTVDHALARLYGGDAAGALARLDVPVPSGGLAPSDRAWLAYARGEALAALGDVGAAVSSFAEAVDLGVAVGHRFVEAVARVSLADAHARAGASAAAFAAYGEALRIFDRHGDTTHALTAIRNLVPLLVTIGDDRDAVLLAAAADDPRRRASYGAEADRLRHVLGEATARCGRADVETWVAEARGHADDPTALALSVVAAHTGEEAHAASDAAPQGSEVER